MWLADSNILIRAASATDHPLQDWLQDHGAELGSDPNSGWSRRSDQQDITDLGSDPNSALAVTRSAPWVSNSANVPRSGLRPLLLLDFATLNTQRTLLDAAQ